VRDILFIDDLVDAFLPAQANMQTLTGQAFNIGGGPANTTSLLELMDLIAELNGKRPVIRFGDWRPADQKYYVSDTGKFRQSTEWRPKHAALVTTWPVCTSGSRSSAGVRPRRSTGGRSAQQHGE